MKLPALDAIQWALAALAVALACFVAFYFITAPMRAAQQAARARATGIQAEAHTAAASDAAKINDAAHDVATANENTSRENADAIRQAPGADLRLDPQLNRTGRERLCLRPSYARTAECMQLARRAQPPG